ncbi:hypothetical protein AYO38_09370 [bacterium SCGC AG-212-C10]|nr:hypothetical protein AYO38_09370 [bacterium SCGC AG-212-C10]
MPFRATEWATGYDLYACIDDGGEVDVGQHPVVIGTGVAMAVPPGWDAQVRPRSGLARNGVLTTYGTLDADYRGELLVTMYTVAPDIRHTVRHGDRIAQIVIARLANTVLVEAAELDETGRGAGGHGSTGR